MKLNGQIQGLASFTWGETPAFVEENVVSEKEETEISNQCRPLNYKSTAHQR